MVRLFKENYCRNIELDMVLKIFGSKRSLIDEVTETETYSKEVRIRSRLN